MKISLRFCALLVLALPAWAPAASHELVKLLPPDTNVVIGISPSKIAGSALIEQALAKVESEVSELPVTEDFLKDSLLGLEELLIGVKAEPGADDDKPTGVAVAHGAFGDNAWRTTLCKEGCSHENYQGFELTLHDSEEQTLAFVVLGDRTAAFGPIADIRAVLDRRQESPDSSVSVDLIADISALSKHPIWLTARGPFDLSAQEGVPPMASGAIEGLKSIGLGLSLDDPLSLSLDWISASASQAEQLYKTAETLLALSEASRADSAEPNFFESLALTRDGARITAQLQMPFEQIKGKFSTGETQVSGQRPASQRPPQRKITIHGLGADPVVVPTQNR